MGSEYSVQYQDVDDYECDRWTAWHVPIMDLEGAKAAAEDLRKVYVNVRVIRRIVTTEVVDLGATQ
jgi:hypothetical protein